MGFEIFQGAGETGWNSFAIARSAQIARDPDDADNDSVLVAHRQLGREAPAGTAMRIPMQFQMVDERAASAKNDLVLSGVKLSKFFWKDFVDVTPKEFLFVAATTAFDERLVDGNVATL